MSAKACSPLEVLRQPAFYPHQPATVELKETHISWVFLVGDLVYKCKKPVGFDFLDFSTLELRRQACEDEVRLNRRLAPDIYLGVVPVTNERGVLQLEGNGEPVEWLVQMRRLPVERTLDQLYRTGSLQPADISRLAETLVTFYQSLPPVAVTSAGYRAGIIKHVRQNRRELLAASHHLPLAQIKRIHAEQLRRLQLQPEVFDARVAAGRIIEGHGDLRPEHICLAEPLAIFDCIEFSEEFRTLDLADELAFLASECDHLGARWVGPQLLADCERLLGDHFPAALIGFYKSYRACVRAKVAALRSDQLAGEGQASALQETQSYLALAEEYLQLPTTSQLIVVGGLSGTGKSTLARELGEQLGIDVLRTDVVRQQLFRAKSSGELYRTDAREQVYLAMFQQAKELLDASCSVILDGTFHSIELLQAAQRLAEQSGATFTAIECTCSPEIAQQRITQRLAAGQDASQADVAVYEQQRHQWQLWPAAIQHVAVDTSQPLEAQLAAVFQRLRLAAHAS
jgi:aminoglycoside phosphotransferase family enzyme/predicted kinase